MILSELCERVYRLAVQATRNAWVLVYFRCNTFSLYLSAVCTSN